MGFESPTPVVTKKSQHLNFSNEGGAGHTFRILKNLTGLWLLQECRKAWIENDYSFARMVALAGESKPFSAFIDTDHASFLHPEDMPTAINDYCKNTGQYVPQNHGEIIRIILEGLAFKFRVVTGQIEALRAVKPETLYMTGGGIKNELLCRFTANSCNIPVVAALDEATATGNIMVQAMALGIVKNVAEIREVTAKSFPSKIYEPEDIEIWDKEFQDYLKIIDMVLK
jgi:rhamnulokinase